MTDAPQKNHPFPTSVKIVLACVLIILIIAVASFEYSRPLQSEMATTTTGVTQGPVIVTTTVQSAVCCCGLIPASVSVASANLSTVSFSIIPQTL